jgi:DNA-directed RNA polymerase subunit RPC12/RpoP
MEKSVSSFKPDEDYYYLRENTTCFKCSECGEEFQKPILATVSSSVSVQKYFACPRCFTKVSDVESRKDRESKEAAFPTKEAKKTVAKLEEGAKCNHFWGYLKKRPKDTPIPDECLTCGKMIECLMH